jgi:hypothetical protein
MYHLHVAPSADSTFDDVQFIRVRHFRKKEVPLLESSIRAPRHDRQGAFSRSLCPAGDWAVDEEDVVSCFLELLLERLSERGGDGRA